LSAEQKAVSINTDEAFKKRILISNKTTVVPDTVAVLSVLNKYNKLKTNIDQLILQLIVDSKQKNRLKLYRQLDKYIKGSSSQIPKAYKQIMASIEHDLYELIADDNRPGVSALESILSITEQISTAITSARDFREKKVGSICEVLDKLRLRDVSELGKKEEDDSAKDDEKTKNK